MIVPGRPKGEFRRAQPEGTPVSVPAHAERARFEASRPARDAVIRNLQTLAESSPLL